MTNTNKRKRYNRKEKLSISWIQLADNEYLIVCVNYSENLQDKAIELINSKNLDIKPAMGKLVSYRYICSLYIVSKKTIIEESDKIYVEKVLKKNESISKVDI